MSVLIKGLKMPEACGKCFVGDREICSNGCPLIELPDHGDLIDRDEVKKKKKHSSKEFFENIISVADIDYAPVVIPAERSEE